MDASRIETLEDCKLWIAAHDAGCEIRQVEHDKQLDRIDGRLLDHENRLTAVERRVVYFSGIAAALGAAMGAGGLQLLGGG